MASRGVLNVTVKNLVSPVIVTLITQLDKLCELKVGAE